MITPSKPTQSIQLVALNPLTWVVITPLLLSAISQNTMWLELYVASFRKRISQYNHIRFKACFNRYIFVFCLYSDQIHGLEYHWQALYLWATAHPLNTWMLWRVTNIQFAMPRILAMLKCNHKLFHYKGILCHIHKQLPLLCFPNNMN